MTKFTSSSSFGAVTWIDVHTGLGSSGQDTLLTDLEEDEMREWFPDAPKVQSEKGGGDVGGGYELTIGLQVSTQNGRA